MIMKKSPSEYRQQKSAQKNSANSKNFPNKKEKSSSNTTRKKNKYKLQVYYTPSFVPRKIVLPLQPPLKSNWWEVFFYKNLVNNF